MKIYIYDPEENHKINLVIPNFLITNRLVISLIQKVIEKENEQQEIQHLINSQQITELLRSLKECVRAFGHFELVNIETAEGEIVKITL